MMRIFLQAPDNSVFSVRLCRQQTLAAADYGNAIFAKKAIRQDTNFTLSGEARADGGAF